MTQQTINKKMKRANELYILIEKKTDGDTMSLINEYVDLNLDLESISNQ